MEFLRSNFVAEAVLAELRAGNYPSDTQADSLDRRPLIDMLREHILGTDIPWVLRLVTHESPKVAGLACSLARHHMKDSEVQHCFMNQWTKGGPYLKNRIMWRLLDVSDLPPRWREMFGEFIRLEWRVFGDFNRTFFGPPDNALAQIASRLLDNTFPETKKWIYLYCIPSVDAAAPLANAVLRLGLTVKDEFAQNLAKDLLQENGPCSTSSGAQSVSALTDFSFIARSVVSALRDKRVPTEIECEQLNQLPIIDEIRTEIEDSDLSWIWPVVDCDNGERAGLFLSLLRQYSHQGDVQSRLRSRWKTAGPFIRAHLMWRILDDPSLPTEWHERLFHFVLTEWEAFQKVSLKFLGTPQTVVTQVLKRIADPAFPKSKKWAYLCRVPQVAEDAQAARAVVLLGASAGDEFAQKVSQVLFTRFFEPSQTGGVTAAGHS